jgi:hypothetical protein
MIGVDPPWTTAQVLQAVWANDVARIEEYYAYIQTSFESGTIDDVTQALAFDAFESPLNSVGRFCEHWRELFPQSYGAHVAAATWHSAKSGDARGSGTVDTITFDGELGMAHHETLLREVAVKGLPLTAKPTLSYRLLGQSLIRWCDDSDMEPEHRDWYERGLAIHPANVGLRLMKLWSATPEWGGSVEEMDAVLTDPRTLALDAASLSYIKAAYHRNRAHTLAYFEGEFEQAWAHVDHSEREVPGLIWNDFARGNVLIAKNDRANAARYFAGIAPRCYQRHVSPLDYWFDYRPDDAPDHYPLALARAELGSLGALKSLVKMFTYGSYSVPKDGQQLEYWSERAFAEGWNDGLHDLSLAIRNGTHGFRTDEPRANELARRGAQAGGMYANLGMWANEDSLKLVHGEAVEYLLKALRSGHPLAPYSLAHFELAKGRVVLTDDGFDLTDGKLTETHIEQAIYFYERAVELDDERAPDVLEKFRKKHSA